MTRSSPNKSTSKIKSRGSPKRRQSRLTPEVNSDVYCSSDESAGREGYQVFPNSKDRPRRRIISESKELKKREKCEPDHFPSRRPSVHSSIQISGTDVSLQNRAIKTSPVNEDNLPLDRRRNKLHSGDKTRLRVLLGHIFSHFKKRSTLFYIIILICAIVYVCFNFHVCYNGNLATNNATIDIIKQKFPKQSDLLWRAISSGLNETLRFDYPSSYILVHEEKAVDTVKQLVKELSHYAVCKLSDCNNKPIELNDKVLSSLHHEADYGVIISKYQKDLENNGVMVIENLDAIPEKYALAFHSFCDQVMPLVKRSAFLFTVKIDKFKESNIDDLRKVEKILREKWNNIEEDIFQPLFARLTAMLIRIYPE